ncbi:MAG: GMC family oxidoreductase [Pseudomonadota bacterium]
MPKKVLTKRERRMVAAFAGVLIPLDAASPEMEPLIERVDDHLRHLTKDTRYAWRASLWMLEIIAFFYYGKCRAMTRMDVALRTRYLNAWHDTWWSVKRVVKRFLETMIFMNYYSLPEVERRIGVVPGFKPPRGSRDFPSANLVREFPAGDVECEVDVCVIGSGAGGASAALALAEKGRSVVVIEEGAYFDASDFGLDAVTMTKRLYRAGGLTNTFGWPPILVPLGRAVGGTTVINSGTCFRTPAKIFERWSESFGLATWAPERMEPFYKRVEDILEVETARDEVQSESARIFSRGAAKLGIDMKPLQRNAPGCCGSGACCWGCPTNAKKSMQLSAMAMAMQAGARVYTRCRAERVRFDRHHATCVEARFIDPVERRRGPRLKVWPRAVVVACGTLHTPVLLGRSRIPNPSGQCGHNLTLHPASKVIALMDEEVRGWEGIPQGHYSDDFIEEGIKLEGIFLPPAFTASTIMLTGREHREAMDAFSRLAVFGMMVSDTTRGRVVRGISGHSISFYTINREDLPKYQRGIALLAEVLFAAGAVKVFPGIHTLPVVTREQGAAVISNLKLRNKDLDLQAFHPLGTCRMGADPREAVVDPAGRVYGLDNLFVADGSIFPTSLGVNPQMTIMAAALKIADYINREYL